MIAAGKSKSGIVVKGIHDLAVRFSKCCSPVPGDEIVGFVTRGRGISIHRTDCINVMNLPQEERERLIEAEWQQPEAQTGTEKYSTEIKIYANNRDRHVCGYFQGIYRAPDRHYLDECDVQASRARRRSS